MNSSDGKFNGHKIKLSVDNILSAVNPIIDNMRKIIVGRHKDGFFSEKNHPALVRLEKFISEHQQSSTKILSDDLYNELSISLVPAVDELNSMGLIDLAQRGRMDMMTNSFCLGVIAHLLVPNVVDDKQESWLKDPLELIRVIGFDKRNKILDGAILQKFLNTIEPSDKLNKLIESIKAHKEWIKEKTLQRNHEVKLKEKRSISPMLTSMNLKTEFSLDEVTTIHEQIDERLVLPLTSLGQATKVQWLNAIFDKHLLDNLYKTVSADDSKIFKGSIVFFNFLLDEHDERLRKKVFAEYKNANKPINEQEFVLYLTNCIKKIIDIEEKSLSLEEENNNENVSPSNRIKKARGVSDSSIFRKTEALSSSVKSNNSADQQDKKASELPASSARSKKRKLSK